MHFPMKPCHLSRLGTGTSSTLTCDLLGVSSHYLKRGPFTWKTNVLTNYTYRRGLEARLTFPEKGCNLDNNTYAPTPDFVPLSIKVYLYCTGSVFGSLSGWKLKSLPIRWKPGHCNANQNLIWLFHIHNSTNFDKIPNTHWLKCSPQTTTEPPQLHMAVDSLLSLLTSVHVDDDLNQHRTCSHWFSELFLCIILKNPKTA